MPEAELNHFISFSWELTSQWTSPEVVLQWHHFSLRPGKILAAKIHFLSLPFSLLNNSWQLAAKGSTVGRKCARFHLHLTDTSSGKQTASGMVVMVQQDTETYQ